jgi:peptidoglycan/LPS O-acetylase OafA/YrhL
VLSGFLIGGILIRDFMNAESFSFASVKRFWIRRWFRTLPNYWLILTINIILYKIMKFGGFEPYKFLFYLFFQNLWYPHPPFFFGEAWSLSVEEWFYLTLPLVMLSALLLPVKNKKRFLLSIFSGYLLTFIVIRVINALHPINGPDLDTGIRKVVVFRLDALMYGVLFAYANYFYSRALDRLRAGLLVCSIFGVTILYGIIRYGEGTILSSAVPILKFSSDAFFYLLAPLFFSLCLPFANSIRSLRNQSLSRVVVYTSKISYSIYLVHYSLVFIPFFSFLKLTSRMEVAGMYMLYLAIIIILSGLLYRYFEHPVMALRDKMQPKPEGASLNSVKEEIPGDIKIG